MKFLRVSIIVIIFLFVSCDDTTDDVVCSDNATTVLLASDAYNDDMSYLNCEALKTAALDFVGNSCDTAGIGDLSFVIDSLNCDQMACALPLAKFVSYGLSMQMAMDSTTYCMLFDSTMMAADTLLKYNCWGEDSTAFYAAYFDSVKTAGCDPTAIITLFSATFHEEYDPLVKSFIFISDSLGSVIADTSFYGSGSFVFNKKYTIGTAPKTIGVTAVTLDEDELKLVTNLGIDIGSDFHYYDPYPNYEIIGQSSYSFINIPDSYYRIIVSSKGNHSRFWTNSEDDVFTLNHDNDNEDVLIMLFRDDGTAEHLIVNNVQIGSFHIIDLSTFETSLHHVINNNTGMNNDYLSAYGYNNGSYVNEDRVARLHPGYGLNRMWNDEGNFIVNYPSLNFTSNFRVNAHVGSQWGEPGGKNYQQTTVGSLPSSVEMIDADFDLINSDLNNFEISHSGSFDQWWVGLEDTSINAIWHIYNSSSTSTMILPSIPTDVIDEYSSLSYPSFYIYRMSLTDWMCVENYKEWVELFHSSNAYYLDFCNGFHNLNFWPEE